MYVNDIHDDSSYCNIYVYAYDHTDICMPDCLLMRPLVTENVPFLCDDTYVRANTQYHNTYVHAHDRKDNFVLDRPLPMCPSVAEDVFFFSR